MRVQGHYVTALTLLLIAGCGVSRPTVNLATVRQAESVLYVHNGDELKEIGAQGGQAQFVFSNDDGAIWTPSLSPDGSKIAFLRVGRRGLLRNQRATLSVYDYNKDTLAEFGEYEYAFEHGANREDPWIGWPRWSPDGRRIVLGDHIGLHVVSVDGDSTRSIAIEDVHEALLVPGSGWENGAGKAVATDGLRIYYVNVADGSVDTLSGADRRGGLFVSKDIRALAFSRIGSRLAFADDRKIYAMDSFGSIDQIHKCSAPVHWLAWLPGDMVLACLSGQSDRLRSIGMGGLVKGSLTLSLLSASGQDETKLYDQVDMDVRDATPSLSSDGRHVVLSSRDKNSRYTLFLIATDGSGQARLGKDKSCFFPVWRDRPGNR